MCEKVMNVEFDARALSVLERLNDNGHEAYFVGGCVRDYLRNVSPHDYDATTSARPEEIRDAFADCPVITTGIRHGTVTVLWEGLPVEVTTYRVDGDYADGRHPEQVSFTRSLTEDLARRDFTVNAMAWSKDSGVVDPFGGREDLREGILRCVGEPALRFEEDSLRILRALRFAATLGFSLDSATESALRQGREGLSRVSPERIREETEKLLCGDHVFPILTQFPEVFGVFLPELLPQVGLDQKNPHHIHDLYTHTAHVVSVVPPKPHLRWAALLHDVAKPETFSVDEQGIGHFYSHASLGTQRADEILRRLKVDGETRKKATALIRYHDAPVDPSERAVRRRLNQLGPDLFFDLIALARADNLAQAPHLRDRQELCDQSIETARRILEEEQCFSLKNLALNGNDLMDLGYRGADVGKGLSFLLDGVLDGVCENERDALLRFLKENFTEKL